jgi:hypothetical protein
MDFRVKSLSLTCYKYPGGSEFTICKLSFLAYNFATFNSHPPDRPSTIFKHDHQPSELTLKSGNLRLHLTDNCEMMSIEPQENQETTKNDCPADTLIDKGFE